MTADAKGPTPQAVGWLSGKIEESGYNGVNITMKSDQENSIKVLKKAVSIKRHSETAMIESPVRVSKSNGQIERAVRTWQSQFRTLRVQLEDRIGCKLPKGSPMMSWLVSFTSDVIRRCKVHPNGRTKFEMVTGHRYKQVTCGFGEKVHFKINTDKNHRQMSESEWSIGYYLGSNGRTTEHIIGSEHGIIECDTFKRMQDDLAYDKACSDTVKVGHRDYICEGASSTIPLVRSSDPLPSNPDKSAPSVIPRRTRITPADLKTYGFTVVCQGCESIEMGHDQRRNHSEACRQRIDTAMKESEAGQERLQRTKDRIDFRTAQAVDEMIANDTGAEVTAAGTNEAMGDGPSPIPAPTELLTGIPEASLDVEMETVQLVAEQELQLQDGASRSTDRRFQHSRTRPGHEEEES